MCIRDRFNNSPHRPNYDVRIEPRCTSTTTLKNEMSQYRGYFVPGGMDPLGLMDNDNGACEIALFLGHNDSKQLRNFFKKRLGQIERIRKNQTNKAHLCIGVVSCFSSREIESQTDYSNDGGPVEIPARIPEGNRIPNFPYTDGLLQMGPGQEIQDANGNAIAGIDGEETSEAYAAALAAADAARVHASRLCNAKFGPDPDTNEPYHQCPTNCSKVKVTVEYDDDFLRLVGKGLDSKEREIKGLLPRLPFKKITTYEFNLNCNNSTRLTSPTGEGLPSHDFKLK